MYFVWLKSLRGVEPQLWADDFISNELIKNSVFKRKLSEAEQTLSLDYLAMKYEYVLETSNKSL